MAEELEICKNCTFWAKTDGAPNEGVCHRFPPHSGNSEVGLFSTRPKTEESDWCGEWEKLENYSGKN